MADYSDSKFDAETGFQEHLFSDTPYDAEDKEADEIYDAVDSHMDGRRKRRREEALKEVRGGGVGSGTLHVATA